MVTLDNISHFTEATRLFILHLASKGDPLAAAMIALPLDATQAPPVLNDKEEEYLCSIAALLGEQGKLFPLAAALASARLPPAAQLVAPAPIASVANSRPHPASSNTLSPTSTVLAPVRAPVRNMEVTMSNAPTRPAPPRAPPQMATGAGPSRPLVPAPAPRAPPPSTTPPANQQVEEDTGVEDEADDSAHTYSSYAAKNIRELFPNVSAHPDPLVETASLASVQLPDINPQIKNEFEILQDDVDLGRLSDAQMESIIYAWIKFTGPPLPDQKRRGFFLGDGAGVGKGRTIAGLAKQHWAAGGRYILWLSVSQDLARDARRDLDDLDQRELKIFEGKGNKLIPDHNFQGVVFITYSLLRSGLPAPKKRKRKKKEAAAAVGAGGSRIAQLQAMEAAGGYSSGGTISGDDGDDDGDDEESSNFEIKNLPETSRLGQVLKWLRHGKEKDQCLIIFDESHRAKNLLVGKDNKFGGKATQTARAVIHLQQELPDAKILYSSATGASEPHNLAYMTRLWGFDQTKDTVELLSNAKLGALELAAISLKATGTYLARTLSYTDAEFHLEKVEISSDFDLMYERSANFWTLLYHVMRCVATSKYWRGQFWGAHQRFYRSMLMAAKVKKCAELCRDAVAQGMSVVIGLQSTGESVTEQMRENLEGSEEFDDLVSAPRQMLDTFIKTNFPLTHPEERTADFDRKLESLEYQVWQALQMWKNMPSVDELAASVPAQTPAAATGAGGAGAGDAGPSTAAATRESLLTGENIDFDRVLTDQERGQLHHDGRALGEDLGHSVAAAREEHKNARINARQQECVIAAKAVSDAKQYKQRLLHAIAVADGIYVAPAPVVASPVALATSGRPAQAPKSPFFIDLTGDSTDEEGDEQNADPDACMQCARPADAGMATCIACSHKVHAACLGRSEIPVNFICHTCKIIGVSCAEGAEADAGALIKNEPGTTGNSAAADNGALQIKPEPVSHAAPAPVVHPEFVDKSLDELHNLLRVAEREISLAERNLQTAHHKVNTAREVNPAAERAAANDILGRVRARNAFNNTINQRRSKLGKERAQEAVNVKSEQGLRSPVRHPTCVTTTTHTEAIPNYRSTTDRPRERLDAVPDEYPAANGGEAGAAAETPNRRLVKIRGWLLLLVQAGLDLPHNPIDKLIADCGGKDKVAELTGRRGFIELDEDKTAARYRQRTDGGGPHRELNLREKDRFMNGSKRIAIISDAASTGISLQADKRVESRRYRRLHLTLELPWSADKAVQQFGRSHRANQQSAPVYKILVTPCGGEYRFASAAAKRLQSLGALLRGDRNAVGAGAELKAFDVDTAAGHLALQRMLRCITSEEVIMPGVNIPELPDNLKMKYGIPIDNNGGEGGEGGDGDNLDVPNGHPSHNPFNIHFCRRLYNLGLLEISRGNLSGYTVKSKAKNDEFSGTITSKGIKITQFLNRLLGLPIEEQDLLFKFFSDTLDATITNLKSLGKYDNSIMSLQGRSIVKASEEIIINDEASGASVKHVTVSLVQGMTFEEAQAMVDEAKQRITELTSGTRTTQQLSGFYVQRSQNWLLSGERYPRIEIALEVADEVASAGRTNFINMREIPPHGQDFIKVRKMKDMREAKWTPIRNLEEAKTIWEAWFNYTATNCCHGENCTRDDGHCKDGCRHIDKHLLCGAVLPYWKRLESLHAHGPFAKKYKRRVMVYENGNSDWRTYYLPNPLFVGRAITNVPGDSELSGEPIVGILAESKEEMKYLKEHMVPPQADPTYRDPLITALGTNHANPNAVRGLEGGSDPFIRRGGNGSGGGGDASGSGTQSKKPKNFR